ncbi:type IIL restriction-modification enzyme MmeI, partial [Pseudomonas sp. F1_0610]|uniref:type IIL restriction-modification enzyme MmeI n=1 Tax=Pseudomonas sp. F1_0610 TaxID=3114284 RepID=UPI0039C1F8D7
ISKNYTNNKKILREGLWQTVDRISPYLTDSEINVVKSRSKPLSKNLPTMGIGNKPIDDGNYLFTLEEKNIFIQEEPASENYFRKWYGTQELKNGKPRYCLLVKDIPVEALDKMPKILERIQKVRDFRLASSSVPTIRLAETPKKFHVENFPDSNYIVIPKISPAEIDYFPVSYFDKSILSSDLLNVVSSSDIFYFGVLSSRIHMVWAAAVSGRFGNGIRYSTKICYNTFPLPSKISNDLKDKIRTLSLEIIEEREQYANKNLGDLYSEDMPIKLKEKHQKLDRAVDSVFSKTSFIDDSERLKVLFQLYNNAVKS